MHAYTELLDLETEKFCTLYLFTNVQNSHEMREKVIKGELRCSLVKASLVAHHFHVLVAANKAAINAKKNQLVTKSIYTEVLYNLSISKNISQSLTEFGINNDDRNIVVVLIHSAADKSMLKILMDTIKGENVPFSRLSEFTDVELIRRVYKIDKDEETVSTLTQSISSRISCKDFISFK